MGKSTANGGRYFRASGDCLKTVFSGEIAYSGELPGVSAVWYCDSSFDNCKTRIIKSWSNGGKQKYKGSSTPNAWHGRAGPLYTATRAGDWKVGWLIMPQVPGGSESGKGGSESGKV